MNTIWTVKQIALAGASNCSHILQLGDFGWTFYSDLEARKGGRKSDFLDPINDTLKRLNMVMGFVDGNHEDFDWLLEQPIAEDGLRYLRSNICHLPRNLRWTWDDVNCLALGGGYSVDKPWRTPHVSWWSQETITDAEAEKAIQDGPADAMFCHDAPSDVEIWGSHRTTDNKYGFPEDQIRASEQHRQKLATVVDNVRPKTLWHGHYHVPHDDPYTHKDGYITRVRGLDKDDNNTSLMEIDGQLYPTNLVITTVQGLIQPKPLDTVTIV